MEKRIHSFFQGMGMGVNSFFKSRNEEWELIPFFKKEWEWDYNPKNQGMDPCLKKIDYYISVLPFGTISSPFCIYHHFSLGVVIQE